MNNREDERELLDQIGKVDGKYVDESAYSEQELNRLKEHGISPATKVQASDISPETAETPIIIGAMNQTPVPEEEIRVKDDRRVQRILRISIGVALAAAAILLFIFLWNPDRGRDIATTTEEATSEETTTLAEETTAAVDTTTVADTTIVEDTTPAETTTAPETTAEETEAFEPDIPLNAEYFPDEHFLRLVSNYDQNKDGYLSPAERKALTEIRCGAGYYFYDDQLITDAPIHSLAGIQYFSELKKLDCSSLSLTELDVTQNHKLEVLNCSYSGLTELDVTQNPELKELFCRDTGLTELDVTQNPELEVLNCSYSGLTELDITQNLKLSDLYCINNKLTALDLSNNVALLLVECSNNQLTSLDLRANQDLCSLSCNANSMSELNISGLSKLGDVKCFCNPSLKVIANNCSSTIEFSIDDTASISGDSANFKILKWYDHATVKDGYYTAELREKDWYNSEWVNYLYEVSFEFSSAFTEASADQNALTIRDAHLLSDSGDHYDCGTISLPLAQTVKYKYTNIYGETRDYKANDFNTFYSVMIEEYESCFSADTSGGLKLFIHILGGSIDEISIQVDEYP